MAKAVLAWMAAKCIFPILSLFQYKLAIVSTLKYCGALQIGEAEGGFALIPGNAPGNFDNIFVKGTTHEFQVREYEGLFYVKPNSNDVFAVVSGET